MKRLRDLARAVGDAALQLTLPLFEPQAPASPRGVPPRALPPRATPPDVAAPETHLPTQTPPAGPTARPPGRRVARLGEHAVEYELRRSRRRTIGFYVDDTGLRVTAPRWVSVSDIDAALADKERWILRKLVEWREHARRRERLAVRWEEGGTVAFLGTMLTMTIDVGPTRSVTRDGDLLRVGLPEAPDAEQLKGAVQAWLQAQARELFALRLPVYTARLGREPTRWRLSSARTRWGSCAPDGSIRLNWRLVHFPLEIVDYVVVHELAHLNEMNHGPRFWATVEALLPEFDAARRLLKDYPDDLSMS
jgi:predicted metal-dependent hydrolase